MIPVSSSPEFIEGQSIHLGCRLRLAQMRQTIFFAVARHPKLEIWIRHFRRPANRATMQCLRFSFACLHFKTATAGGHITALASVAHDTGTEEDQVIRHRTNRRGAKLHRTDNDLKKRHQRKRLRWSCRSCRANKKWSA